MIWNMPNVLTTLRLLAAPMVAVMFLYFTRPYADWFALILFVGAAITDWFDGYLARAWGQQTKFGAMLDPIADKAMVVIALMVIIGFSSWSPWLVLPATVILF
ncbi:MAG: CDP-alcohol phosphatidyltransferase family protein, partial [Pseudomonadota bacterium]